MPSRADTSSPSSDDEEALADLPGLGGGQGLPAVGRIPQGVSDGIGCQAFPDAGGGACAVSCGALACELASQGLADENHLWVQPAVRGCGDGAFHDRQARRDWVHPSEARRYHHAVPDRRSRNGLLGAIRAAVDDIVAASHPVKVILFGSVARGDAGPDSDLDFLVVLDRLDPAERARRMGQIRFAISVRAPTDIFVTDVEEFDRRKNVNGSMLYWPAREGKVVYERSAA